MAADNQMAAGGRRRRRWVWRLLVGLVLLVVALPAVAFGLLQTGWGQRQGLAVANDVLAASGLSLRAEGISGLVPFDMSIDILRLDDIQGTAIAMDDLELRVAAGDLLAGQVTIVRVAASRASVARAPITPPGPESPPSEPAWPTLPVDIAVDRLDLERLELGAALVGEDIALSVDGNLALGESAGTASLTVERLDGNPARVVMTARADPRDNTLSLDLVAEEPEGGVVPRLAGWDYDGPWRLSLQGDGPMNRWEGTLLATAGGRTLTDLAVSGAIDPEAPNITVTGVVTPPADLMPPDIETGPVAIDLTAGLVEDTASAAGTLSGRGLDLILDATASLGAPISIDITLDARSEDLATTLAGLDLPVAGDARVEASARGPLDALDGSVSLQSRRLEAFDWSAEDVALAATFSGAPLTPSGSGVLTLAARNPRSPDLDLEAYAIETVDLRAAFETDDGNHLTLTDLALDAGSHSLAGTVSLDTSGGPVGFDLTLDTDAGLAMAVADLGQASGGLSASLSGAFDPAQGVGWVEAAAEGREITIADPMLDALVGPSPSLTASGQVDTGYGLQGMTAALRLPHLRADIAGDLAFDPADDTAAPLTFAIAIDSLSPLAEPFGFAPDDLAGSIELSGNVGAPLSATPRAVVDLEGDQVRLFGQSLGTVDATLAAVPGDEGLILTTVDASLDGDYGPVTSALGANIDPAAQRIALAQVNVTALGVALSGAIDVDLAPLAIDGTLDASIGNLASLQGLTGTPLGGSASARIVLSHEDGSQNAAVRVNARSLAVEDAVRVDGLSANFTLADLFGNLRFRGTAQASTAATDVAVFEETTVEASGTLADLDFTFAATGESAYLEEPFPIVVDAEAAINLSADALTLRLNSLDGRFDEEALTLAQPLTVRRAGQALSIAGLDARLLGGRIVGEAQLSPGSTQIDIAVNDIDLARSAVLTGGAGASATIDAINIALSGPGNRPSGTAELRISGVQVEGDGAAGTALAEARLVATATVREGMVDLEAQLGNVTASPITFTLANAWRLAVVPFALEPDHGQPLDGRLQVATDLRELNPILAPTGNILLGGQAEIDIRVGGVGGAPVLSGAGEIANASVEVAEIGLILRDLNAEIAGENERLTIRRLTASDPHGGSLSASGWADFGGAEATVDVDTSLNRLRAFNTDYAEADVSGTVSLAGPLASPTITGDVTVRPAEIRFAEFRTSGYVEVDAIDVNGRSQLPDEPTEAPTLLILPLDIAVSIPNAFYVRGYGLDSEWGGNLQVAGTTAVPRVTGRLNVLRGSMDLAGQAVDIQRGIVTFTGASPPNPLVDLEAVTATEDISISMTVSGTASATEFKLQSAPDLPQEEILSRLLFGVGRGALSGNQALQAGRAIALLGGGEGDLGLVNTLRDITGISGLSFDTDGEGGPAGSIGGYVDENVYLSVTRGTATGSGEAEINFEVFEGINLESSVTETGDSEVGINFEWDY